MKQSDTREAIKVSTVNIAINLGLFTFKIISGIVSGSTAMLSDAAHMLTDILATLAVIIGVNLSCMECDKEHPYGHERFECVAAILLSAVLFATGIGIGLSGVKGIIAGVSGSLHAPGGLALVAAAISIVLKETMYIRTKAIAKKTGSGALMADAWHHRADALSSLGTFAGILGAMLGFPVLDPAACVVISGLIIKAAIGVFADATSKMTDKSCDDALENEIRDVVASQPGVKGIDLLNTRLFGSRLCVDVEITADAYLPLSLSHGIAHSVRDAVEERFPDIKHCMVHVNPYIYNVGIGNCEIELEWKVEN